MRVLMLARGHLQPTPKAPEVGGAGRQCLKLSRALIQQNIPVTIVTDRLSWGDPARQTIQGVPVVFLNTGRPYVYRKGLKRLGNYVYILSTMRYLFQHRAEYDIIHAHSARLAGFVSVFAGTRFKKKSIFKVMNSGERNDALQLRHDRSLLGAGYMASYLRRCDCVISLNEQASAELRQMGFRPDQIALIPNGVEDGEIEPKNSYQRPETLRVIFVGRLSRSKGLDSLLKAFKILVTGFGISYCRLLILGKGELLAQLQELAGRLDITPYVDFAGEVADVFSYLSASSIFVLPSYGEGISNALLEAMAAGLACITTDTAGNNTLIRHRQNGILIGVTQNEVELAEALCQLATDDDLRERLGRAARRTVETDFSIAAIARRYIDLYQRLLASP